VYHVSGAANDLCDGLGKGQDIGLQFRTDGNLPCEDAYEDRPLSGTKERVIFRVIVACNPPYTNPCLARIGMMQGARSSIRQRLDERSPAVFLLIADNFHRDDWHAA